MSESPWVSWRPASIGETLTKDALEALERKYGEALLGRAKDATRFIDGIKVVDQKTGQVFQGRVDLGQPWIG
ncbi:hypothetical protein [Pseudomonas sp. 5P_3.1_Bac2]|uniref:hypothetical protein n=1 Tax=Pseudomonas sp. 5P_3.1_Bac2 TaxID=2971617 RepID=UPI0021C8E8B8|nr:hypothetical protein [Pseudomonas sp. 5P_3.1_Bac2]MCU1719278.1 hypothetical protein [Pseudomonas sp. 5P_3.1_Bac2]